MNELVYHSTEANTVLPGFLLKPIYFTPMANIKVMKP